MTYNTFSPVFCETHHVLYLSETSETIEIGITEKTEEQSKLFLQSFFDNKEIVYKTLEEKDFSLRLNRIFSRENISETISEEDKIHNALLSINSPIEIEI